MDLMINGLGEVTAAAARDRWAACGAVTPHPQRAEALTADTTRCLSHAAGIYAFHTTVRSGVPPTQTDSDGSPGGCDADDDNLHQLCACGRHGQRG